MIFCSTDYLEIYEEIYEYFNNSDKKYIDAKVEYIIDEQNKYV